MSGGGTGTTYAVSGENTEWEDILIKKGITTQESVLIGKGINPDEVISPPLPSSCPLSVWSSLVMISSYNQRNPIKGSVSYLPKNRCWNKQISMTWMILRLGLLLEMSESLISSFCRMRSQMTELFKNIVRKDCVS